MALNVWKYATFSEHVCVCQLHFVQKVRAVYVYGTALQAPYVFVIADTR